MKGGTCYQCRTCEALFRAYAPCAAHANDAHGGGRIERYEIAKGHLVLEEHDYGDGKVVTFHDVDMAGAHVGVTTLGAHRQYAVVIHRPGREPFYTGSYKTERAAFNHAERIREAMKCA